MEHASCLKDTATRQEESSVTFLVKVFSSHRKYKILLPCEFNLKQVEGRAGLLCGRGADMDYLHKWVCCEEAVVCSAHHRNLEAFSFFIQEVYACDEVDGFGTAKSNRDGQPLLGKTFKKESTPKLCNQSDSCTVSRLENNTSSR
jgi:hypothetical protein